jgi:hypothetical protein
MPHNKFSWKMPDDKILEMIHSNLLRVFHCENYEINIEDICFYLNISPTKIHSNKKHNSLLSYIKINYGGILQFLKQYSFFSISQNNNSTIIKLDIDYFNIYGWNNRITPDSEWIFIDEYNY